MSEIILHHYPSSPFAEKVRVCLGIKGLAWRSVEQPVIMPKPALVALTGGYRRIPVMQIGADVWCDTLAMVAELERRAPEPSLFPGGDRGLGQALALWTDRLMFQAAVALIFGGLGDRIPPAFVADRQAMSGARFDPAALAAGVPHMAGQLRACLAWVEAQLGDGRPFLTGDHPGLADASAYYNLWFLRSAYPPAAALADPFAAVLAWEARVRAIGHGTPSALAPDEAIAVARGATPAARAEIDTADPSGFSAGERVAVAADDYGRDPIVGTLVTLTATEVAIRREDAAAGEVVVHFPRVGFTVARAPHAQT